MRQLILYQIGYIWRAVNAVQLYKSFLFGGFLIVGLLNYSCGRLFNSCDEGKGDNFKTERVYNTINTIETLIPLDLHLIHDTSLRHSRIEVFAQENVVEKVSTTVVEHEMTIDFNDCLEGHNDIAVYVYSPDYKKIIANSPCRVFSENAIQVDTFDIEINQSSIVDLFYVGLEFNAELNGQGEVLVKGSSTYFNLNAEGNTEFGSYDFFTDTTAVSTQSSKDFELRVFGMLDVNIKGSGDVFYKGEPEIEQSGSGSGQLIDAN